MRRILGKPYPLGAEEGAEARERLVEPRGVAPGPEHVERLRLPVEARLHATHETAADKDRQHVVPVLPLRLRDVHLEAVVEIEERLRAVAVVDQAIERREEGDAIGNSIVGRFRMCFPPLRGKPDTQRSEPPLRKEPLGLA